MSILLSAYLQSAVAPNQLDGSSSFSSVATPYPGKIEYLNALPVVAVDPPLRFELRQVGIYRLA